MLDAVVNIFLLPFIDFFEHFIMEINTSFEIFAWVSCSFSFFFFNYTLTILWHLTQAPKSKD